MRVEPLEHEPTRWLVESRSRAGLVHLVDSDYEGGWACSCEQWMVRGRECPHIRAVQMKVGNQKLATHGRLETHSSANAR